MKERGVWGQDVSTMEIAVQRIQQCVNGILDLSNLKLTELPSLPEGITLLKCSFNQLTFLPPLPSTLKTLICSSNRLTSLPELPSLHVLYCYANQLTSLPPLPSSLRELHCFTNRLTILPPLPSTIQYLQCCRNPLTTLPTLPFELRELLCTYCTLISLPPLPTYLRRLMCYGNPLDTLPDLPSTLQELRSELPIYEEEEIKYGGQMAYIDMHPLLVEVVNQKVRKAATFSSRQSKERCMKRCAQYKEEIMMKAWRPSRVKMLYEMGWDMEDI